MTSSPEKTLIFLKPDATIREYVGARVLRELIRLPQSIPLCFRILTPGKEFFRDQHYAIHNGKFFFEWLLDYVTSSHIAVLILEGHHIIDRVRERLGPTVPEKASQTSPMSIRGKYGMFGGVNLVHASDSAETALREVALWSCEFELDNDSGALRNVLAFIEERIDSPCIDAVRYRELFNQVVSDPASVDDVSTKFEVLLRKESSQADSAVKALSRVMVWRGLIEEATAHQSM